MIRPNLKHMLRPFGEPPQPIDAVPFLQTGPKSLYTRERSRSHPGKQEKSDKSDNRFSIVRAEKGGKYVDIYTLCSVCKTKNSGLVAMCLRCGHGGHLKHVQEWFANANSEEGRKCAVTSCQCHCVFERDFVSLWTVCSKEC